MTSKRQGDTTIDHDRWTIDYDRSPGPLLLAKLRTTRQQIDQVSDMLWNCGAARYYKIIYSAGRTD